MVSLLFLYTPSITSVKFNNTTEYHSQIIGYFCLVAAIVLPAIFIFYMFAKFDGKLELRPIIGDNPLNNLTNTDWNRFKEEVGSNTSNSGCLPISFSKSGTKLVITLPLLPSATLI